MERMKIVLSVVLWLLTTAVCAGAPQVSGDFADVTLRDWLEVVGRQTGVTFEFQTEVDGREPINLDMPRQSLEEALHQVLRPRALEAVRTSEKEYVVISLMTPRGMAKRTGRAILALESLEAKLEKARQRGDEVDVPGWTAADSRRGISAFADFFGAVLYFEMEGRRPDRSESNARALDFLTSPDRLVRIGAVLPMLAGYARPRPGKPNYAEVKRHLAELLDSEDPHERAAATFTCLISGSMHRVNGELAGKAIESGMDDPVPVVRFATVLGALDNRRIRQKYPRYSNPADYPVAAVRLVARLGQMFEAQRRRDAEAIGDAIGAILQDPNPIARSFALPFVAMLGRRPRHREVVGKILDDVDDPWVNLWAEPIRAMEERDLLQLLTSMHKLLTSDKPSHRTLAATAMFVGSFAGMRRAGGEGIELPDLGAFRNSEQPIVSLAAWAMSAPRTTDDNVLAQVEQILKSGPEHQRLGILTGCLGEAPRGLSDACRQRMNSPIYIERYLAVQAISRGMSFDQALALMREQLRKGDMQTTRMVLNGVRVALYRGTQEERTGRLEKLSDLIFAEGSVEIQSQFLNRFIHMFYRHGEENQRLLDMIWQKGDVRALLELVESGRMASHYLRKSFPSLAERVTREIEKGTERDRRAVVRLVTELFASGRMHWHALQGGRKEVLGQMLTDVVTITVLQEDGDRSLGLTFLAGIFGTDRSPTSPWEVIPPAIRESIPHVLKLVSSPDHETADKAGVLLGGLYRNIERWNREAEPGEINALHNAMDEARRWVEENGTAEQQVNLLIGLTRHADDRHGASQELQERLVAGTVPGELRRRTLSAVAASGEVLRPAFANHCIDLFRNLEDQEIRSHAVRVLTRGAMQLRGEDAERPAWFTRAAAVAWAIGDRSD